MKTFIPNNNISYTKKNTLGLRWPMMHPVSYHDIGTMILVVSEKLHMNRSLIEGILKDFNYSISYLWL